MISISSHNIDDPKETQQTQSATRHLLQISSGLNSRRSPINLQISNETPSHLMFRTLRGPCRTWLLSPPIIHRRVQLFQTPADPITTTVIGVVVEMRLMTVSPISQEKATVYYVRDRGGCKVSRRTSCRCCLGWLQLTVKPLIESIHACFRNQHRGHSLFKFQDGDTELWGTAVPRASLFMQCERRVTPIQTSSLELILTVTRNGQHILQFFSPLFCNNVQSSIDCKVSTIIKIQLLLPLSNACLCVMSHQNPHYSLVPSGMKVLK
jgi:hypothetical protein